jgi:hypothetical protein
MVMCFGKARIDFDRVAELDDSFTIFALLEIALTALKILFLADVRIAGTRTKKE